LIITFIFLFFGEKKNLQGSNSPNKHDIDLSEKAAGPVTQAFIVSLYYYKNIEHLIE